MYDKFDKINQRYGEIVAEQWGTVWAGHIWSNPFLVSNLDGPHLSGCRFFKDWHGLRQHFQDTLNETLLW
jgi:hypothetical protein